MSRRSRVDKSPALPFFSNTADVPDENDSNAIARARIARDLFNVTSALPLLQSTDRVWRHFWQDVRTIVVCYRYLAFLSFNIY